MAIYHLHAGVGRRSKNDSAKEKCDYIFRQGRYAEKAVRQKEYLDRQGDFEGHQDEVVFSASENMPGWAQENPNKYWSAVDKCERKNGILFRSIEFALPTEMNDQQREKLAVSFARRVSKVNGGQLPFSLAIHYGKGHNPHCHLILSERINDGIPRPTPQLWFKRAAPEGKDPARGGAKKAQIGNKAKAKKEWLLKIREMWERIHNAAVKKWRVAADPIDHRSYKAQGIDRIPQVHLGPALFKKIVEERPDNIPFNLILRTEEFVKRCDMIAAQEQAQNDDQRPAPR